MLVGIGVNAVLAALTTLLVVRYPVDLVTPAILWLTGTLYARDWSDITTLAAGLGVLLPAGLALMPHLRTLQLGDDTARALGARTEPARSGLLVAGVRDRRPSRRRPGRLRGADDPSPGPHADRAAHRGGAHAGRRARRTARAGSDLIAQHAFSPISLPVGVVTAAVGAPYFLSLLYRSNRAS